MYLLRKIAWIMSILLFFGIYPGFYTSDPTKEFLFRVVFKDLLRTIRWWSPLWVSLWVLIFRNVDAASWWVICSSVCLFVFGPCDGEAVNNWNDLYSIYQAQIKASQESRELINSDDAKIYHQLLHSKHPTEIYQMPIL